MISLALYRIIKSKRAILSELSFPLQKDSNEQKNLLIKFEGST